MSDLTDLEIKMRKLYKEDYRIQSHPYHTAYVLRFVESSFNEAAIEYLRKTKLDDGTWGSLIEYNPDKLLSTLAVVNTIRIKKLERKLEIQPALDWIMNNIEKILISENQLVGNQLVLGRELVIFCEMAGIEKDLLNIKLEKFKRLINKIQSIDITQSYYVWSLEAFDPEYVRKLNPEYLIQEDGSVFGIISASAFYYSVAHDDDKSRILAFISSFQNEDGGFGNFKADYVAILFSSLPLLITGKLHLFKDIISPLIQPILANTHKDGITLGSSFPVGDLDDTVTAYIIASSLNIEIPFDIEVLLEKYKKYGYRTYIPHTESIASSRMGQEIVETEIIAKTGAVYVKIDNEEEVDLINQLLTKELLKSNKSRWYIFPEYQLPQIMLFVMEYQSPELISLLREYCMKYLSGIEVPKLIVSDLGKISCLIITLVMGITKFGWEFEQQAKKIKDIGMWMENTNIPENFHQLWISKVLYSIPIMDKMWIYCAKYLIYENSSGLFNLRSL